jgi:hypothetical protein
MPQGNYTTGAERRGNRNGRKPVHAPGTPLLRVQLKVPLELHSLLRVMGAGNATEGLRKAIAWAAHVMPLEAQDPAWVDDKLLHSLGGKITCRDTTAAAFGKLQKGLQGTWE